MSDDNVVHPLMRTDAQSEARPPGRWYAGMPSPNPGGRPKAIAEVVELARQHTPEAIATLAAICVDKEASKSARIAAANSLLDRGWGRPAQGVELSGPNGAPLSEDQEFSSLELARCILFELAKAEHRAALVVSDTQSSKE